MSTQQQNRANGKLVTRTEYISSTQVVVHYDDFSKKQMTVELYKTMHGNVKA